ncbi:unnamed protein product [Dicrocoelium dendriticum]|nr:unnamed protein product [Dicrocoelium dendriticum]
MARSRPQWRSCCFMMVHTRHGFPILLFGSRIFRRLPFLLPLCIISWVALCIYAIKLLSVALFHDSDNSDASAIRDGEELRLAKSLTKINEWKHRGDFLPFRYTLPHHTGFTSLPGVTFAILFPNRRRHQIDSYEPSYCIESLTRLLSAIEYDLTTYGRRFSFINITLCPTEDRLDDFSELIEVTSLLPKGSVKPRLRLMDNLSLACRTVLDSGSCLLQSAVSSNTSYIVLFEDDMMIEEYALNQLWTLFQHFNSQKNISSPKAGSSSSEHFTQLHMYYDQLQFSIYDFRSLLELFASGAFLTFVSFGLCLRRWYRPFLFRYNCLLLTSTFFVCTLIASLFGRSWWLLLWHKLFTFQSIFVSDDPSSHSTGSSFLLSVRLARGLGHFLHTLSCTELDQYDPPVKSRLIRRYLTTHHVQTFGTFPNLFKHGGLYSFYRQNAINPRAVEWY